MTKKIVAVLALAVPALFLAGATGVYAYDASREDHVAEGVIVAGVDVGGLSAKGAEDVLSRSLRPGLRRPVLVVHEDRKWTLNPDKAGVRLNLERMVDEALARSREGGMISRVWRDVRDRPLQAELPLRVAYSRASVRAFVRRVQTAVDRDPVDASVTPSLTTISSEPSRDGLAVRPLPLRQAIAAQLTHPQASHLVRVPTRVVKPKVTTAGLPQAYPYYVTVSRGEKVLRLFQGLRLMKSYRIAVGAVGYETPTGVYAIQNKAVNPAWHVPNRPWAGKLAGRIIPGGAPDNPIVARWMGIYNGAGIHGTNSTGSLGSAASHGCIRMAIPDVIDLYDRIPVATPVYIA